MPDEQENKWYIWEARRELYLMRLEMVLEMQTLWDDLPWLKEDKIK